MDWNPPDRCPAGHSMAPPNVKVGWTPCDCAKAAGRPTGHLYAQCWTCKREWREGNCDQLADGYEISPEAGAAS